MDYRDWLILKTISEEKNITKAAEKLFLSQPALTYRIRCMEKEFSTKILSRHPSGVLFTPTGEYLLKYSLNMINQLQTTKNHLHNMSGLISGTLRLGSSSVFSIYMLPALLKEFLETYPHVELYLKTGLSKQISALLQKKEVSIAIIRGDYHWPGPKILLKEEPICLVSHRKIAYEELPHFPQISYVTDSSLESVMIEWWRDHFSTPPPTCMEVDNMTTCRQMILAGLGWAILPLIGLENQSELFVQPLYDKNKEPLMRRTWLMYEQSSEDLIIIRTFINFVKNYFSVS